MTWSLDERRLYLCAPLRDDLVEFVTECVRGGVDIVQLRAKEAGDDEVVTAAAALVARCRELGVPCIVNDRPDLAAAAGADGVHVGQDDVDVATCRAVLGDDAIVGISTHGYGDLDRALALPVTYLSAGPVEPTPTKPGRAGTGIDYVRDAAARSAQPVFVTGGVTAARVEALASIGIRHFVVVRALTEAADPRAAARSIAESIDASVRA